jgi:hypothetical protein
MFLTGGGMAAAANVPRAVTVARTTAIPACTRFVDTAFTGVSNGTAQKPHKTIAGAIVAAGPGAVICVAQGVYPERLTPGTKPLTLAGGFQRNRNFTVRNSALYVSRAQGNGTGSFVRIEDPGPSGNQLTAIDGFEITGYSQAIYRDIFVSQRFDITNNNIHDNVCASAGLAGAGFALNNVSGAIRGNVFARNRCGRGGAGFLNDSTNSNTVVVARNRVVENVGDEPGISHGGALYLFNNRLTILANSFVDNRVTGWGAGLYVGAFAGGGQNTFAALSWNLYRENRAGIAGGGFFCDDSAKCFSNHEIYDSNCGGNIYVDSGPGTTVRFDHLTNYRARTVGCGAAGVGVQIDKGDASTESHSFTNSIFFGNAPDRDFAVSCPTPCSGLSINVSWSIVDRQFLNNGGTVTFGAGVLTPRNPLFVNAAAGNFHLKSRFGHWTPAGYVTDAVSSPALAKGNPASPVTQQPPRAGNRTELGAYGNSVEASYVQ